jgi:glycerol-3-phosphate acyltransferase PlsY
LPRHAGMPGGRGVGAIVGLTVGLTPLAMAKLRLPTLVLVIPWREITALELAMLVAVVAACVLALRPLSAT